jgi:DNA-binding PadR family transcriptional regulator
MLLTLYADALDSKQTTITELIKVSDSGSSTIERWIKALEQEGLVMPAEVASDGSDSFTLSEKGWFAMDAYFENMSSGMI